MKYISKGGWFDKGTEAKLLSDCSQLGNPNRWGIFEGVKDGKPDEECCGFDEFEEVENE